MTSDLKPCGPFEEEDGGVCGARCPTGPDADKRCTLNPHGPEDEHQIWEPRGVEAGQAWTMVASWGGPTIAEAADLLARGSKPTVPEVRKLIWDYLDKPANICGGSLHIVLEDGNITDGDIEFCIENAKQRGDPDGEALARVLLLCSQTQRRVLTGR